MSETQQIEEMASYYCAYCKEQTGKEFCRLFDEQDCSIFSEAEIFYNAGYRKLPENAVVLTREEYDKIKTYQSYIPEMKKAFDKIRNAIIKETAKEILQGLEEKKERVKAFYGTDESVGVDIAIRAIKEILKQKGVEAEQ